MTTPLQQHLQTLMRDHKMTIGQIERKAGLRINAVRNIVNGLSRKPSAETLQAIADTFNCSVKELLSTDHLSTTLTQDPNYQLPLEDSTLLSACVQMVLELCQQHAFQPSLQKTFFMIGDLYLYSLETKCSLPSVSFARWLLRRHKNNS